MNDEYGIFTAKEFIDCKDNYRPLIDKFLFYGDRMFISAKRKQGKTVLILQIIFNLTTGKPFLDIYEVDKPCKVLYLMCEGYRPEIASRIVNMNKAIDIDWDNLHIINIRGIGLHTKQGIDRLKQMADSTNTKYDVIIIDPLYKTLYGGDINSAKDATMWTDNVDSFIGSYNATGIVVVHRSPKTFTDKSGNKHESTSEFGSSNFENFITHSYVLNKRKNLHSLDLYLQRSGKMIEKQEMKMITPEEDAKGRLFYTANIDETGTTSNQLIIENFLKEKKQYRYPDIWRDLSMAESTFCRCVKPLLDSGLINKYNDEHGKRWYQWTGN